MQLSASHDTKTYYRLRKLEMTDIHAQQETIETPDTIEDIRLDLIEDLEATRKWRERKAEEYPSDSRNHRAQQTISRLLETVNDVNPALLVKFEDTLDAQSTDAPWDNFRKALGFKYAPQSAAELLLAFCADPGRFVIKLVI
jgi:hypothetical protein